MKRKRIMALFLAGVLTAMPVMTSLAEDAPAQNGGEVSQTSGQENAQNEGGVKASARTGNAQNPPAQNGDVQDEGTQNGDMQGRAADGAAVAADMVVIYHTNDMHGSMNGNPGNEGLTTVSISQAAALKKNTVNALLVDAGDATQGVPLASLSKGQDVIRLMNQAGYDVMCLGNHEFDYGIAQLQSNIALAEFPVLSANVSFKDSGEMIAASEKSDGQTTVLEAGGRKIGVIGVTTKDTATKSNPTENTSLTFGGEVEAVQDGIDSLEAQNVDAIVALCHLGDESAGSSCTSTMLADAMTGDYQGKLDAIIDGHSHTVEGGKVNEVFIAQTGYNMGSIGKLTLDFQDEAVAVDDELLTVKSEEVSGITPDGDTQALLEQIQSEQKVLTEQVVCRSEQSLWGGWLDKAAVSRRAQTTLGELSAAAMWNQAAKLMQVLPGDMQEKYGDAPLISVENGGGVRGSILNGEITKGDILTVFPFSNTTVIKEITPKVLYEMLERSVATHTAQDKATGMVTAEDDGSFLQAYGFYYVYDPEQPKGSKVSAVEVEVQTENGLGMMPLERTDDSTVLILATNSYVAAKAKDFPLLAACPVIGEGVGEAEALEDILNRMTNSGLEPLRGVTSYYGAIPKTAAYESGRYTAKIHVTDKEGNPMPNAKVSYYLDAVREAFTGTTDENGMLSVENLMPGEHSIRQTWESEDIYINNYVGFGVAETAAFSWPVLVCENPESPVQEVYSITYELDGGENHAANPSEYTGDEELIVLKNPTKPGYLFEGWYAEADYQTKVHEILQGTKGNLTFYAKWKKDKLEPNDTAGDAVKAKLPDKIQSTIAAPGDVDYFRFTLKEEARVHIGLSQPEELNVFYGITLYDEKEKELASGKLNGVEQSVEKVMGAGDYYVKVEGMGNTSSLKPYTLRLSRMLQTEAAYNFSEMNMMMLTQHPNAVNSYSRGFDQGGNHIETAAYLARWEGPVLEADDPFNTGNVFVDYEPGKVPEDVVQTLTPLYKAPQYHVQNVKTLPARSGPLDNDRVKAAVRAYGGVSASLGWTKNYVPYDGYYKAKDYTEEEKKKLDDSWYMPAGEAENGGHAIAIVGWDDNYSKENFTTMYCDPQTEQWSLCQPPGDGAFIIKDSFGEESGEGGYVYLSYYTDSLASDSRPACVIFTEEGTANYNTVYQYDELGPVGYYNTVSDFIYAANVFTSEEDEVLRAVSLWCSTPDTQYDVFVEINDNPRQYVASGYCETVEYKTIRLNRDVTLNENPNPPAMLGRIV